MTYRYQLYKCPICGTVTEIVHDGVSAMICCGKTMEVLDDREPLGPRNRTCPSWKPRKRLQSERGLQAARYGRRSPDRMG